MTWLFSILIVLALGGVAMVAAGRGGSLAEPERDRVRVLPADGPLAGADGPAGTRRLAGRNGRTKHAHQCDLAGG